VYVSMRRHALTKNKIGIARPNVNYTIRTVDENPTSPYVDDCVVLLSLSLAEHGQNARRGEVTQRPPVHQPVSPHTRHRAPEDQVMTPLPFSRTRTRVQ
jgi:hypothetical protein